MDIADKCNPKMIAHEVGYFISIFCIQGGFEVCELNSFLQLI